MTINWTWPPYILKWKYKKWAIEKWFQSEIIKNLRNDWFICYHPPDIWPAYRFLDLICISIEWNINFIEFKKISWATFNVKFFEESQIHLLMQLDSRNKDLARVFIYSSKYNKYKVLTFTEIWKWKNSKWGIKIF